MYFLKGKTLNGTCQGPRVFSVLGFLKEDEIGVSLEDSPVQMEGFSGEGMESFWASGECKSAPLGR